MEVSLQYLWKWEIFQYSCKKFITCKIKEDENFIAYINKIKILTNQLVIVEKII